MILITGATGTIVSQVRRLAREAQIPAKLMVRDASKLDEADHIFEICEGDFSSLESLEMALQGVEKALLLTKPSPDQFGYDSHFINAAISAGVKKVVKISALGASPKASSVLNQWQAKSENLLIESGLDYVILRPQFFMQNLLMMGRAVQKKGQFSFPVEGYSVAMISAADIAASALAALSDDGVRNRILSLTGPEALTMEKVAEFLSELTGSQVGYRSTEVAPYIEKLKAAGLPDWSAEGLGNIYNDMRQYDGFRSSDVMQLTGSEPLSLGEFLEPYGSVFKAAD